MNLPQLSKVLSELFNTLGNSFLEKNYQIEKPFDFTVYVRRADITDENDFKERTYDFIAEIYTDRPFPRTLISNKDPEKRYDYSFVDTHFKKLIPYIDSTFDNWNKIGLKFMDLKHI